MSDPFQKCPASLSKISSPRASCGKSTGESCNGFTVPTSPGVSYKTVCGRFRGYQVGSPDAFGQFSGPASIDGSDYYANQVPRDRIGRVDYHEDPLWDGQQCGGLEANFCKTFATTISGDIEVRLCGNQDLQDENMHCSSGVFELQQMEDFLREAKEMANWNHARVVKLLGVCTLPFEVDKDDGLRLRLSSTKDEAEQDYQEMKEENTLPGGMESNPITILGHVNAPFPADD
ncbi:hypothetical protein EMCRGX_G007143 [Ephydatia muelleri]